jgi:hypothetical protein
MASLRFASFARSGSNEEGKPQSGCAGGEGFRQCVSTSSATLAWSSHFTNKFSTFRLMVQDVFDVVAREIGLKIPCLCRTHSAWRQLEIEDLTSRVENDIRRGVRALHLELESSWTEVNVVTFSPPS